MKGMASVIALASSCFVAGCVTHPQSSASPEHIMATHGSVRIESIRQGKGPVIVILPSLGRGADDFDQVAALLERDGFTVLRPQPRGIGESVGPLTGIDMHDFAADIAAVLDQQKTGPVVVVGHAWGSQPARMLAVDRPDLVRGLVMAAASAGKLPPGSKEKPYGRLRDAIDGSGNLTLPEAQRFKYLQQAFFAPGHDPGAWLNGWYPATHEAEAHARDVTPVDAYFAGGTVPILDLEGQYDAVVVPNVFKTMLGDRVTVEVVPNAGHAMAPEQPFAMSQAIARFAHKMYRQ
ncbi:alpha/beta fold hydrolase [Paraburkholderia graminis]|jgi:pimeloyl-ACP methyl ester carboxylesterase|uniref:alpha/beta fold hydrolase n=1 Tax=Paraburkholderia graminis TaxID=60548 RepID=UPI0027907672|nr:alpha/beta hydrolase [Paraburkholderia graminis]MDQ0621024.1 pimeloyl-ACP methyl ester carboxylesterase [Paraburkholderia graminis]